METENLGEGRAGMVLKPEYQDLYEEWETMAMDGGCTCFINPPCSYCTHDGNPMGLNDNDDAWEAL